MNDQMGDPVVPNRLVQTLLLSSVLLLGLGGICQTKTQAESPNSDCNLHPSATFTAHGHSVLSSPTFIATDNSSPSLTRRVYVDGRVTALAFSPDGGTIAVGGDSLAILLLDAATGRTIRSIPFFSDDELALLDASPVTGERVVRDVAYSPDAKVLAVGHSTGLVKLFDTHSGQLKSSLDDVRRERADGQPLHDYLRLPLAHEDVSRVAFSRDGVWIATCGQTIDYRRDRVRRLGAGPTAGLLKLWRADSGKLQRDLDGEHNQQVMDVAFSPGDQYLASVGNWRNAREAGSGVKLWNLQNLQVASKLVPPESQQQGATPLCMGLSADATKIALGSFVQTRRTGESRGWIQIFDIDSGTVQTNWLVDRPVRSVAFTADNKSVAALSGKCECRLWNPATGQTQAVLQSVGNPADTSWTAFALSPKDDVIVIGGRNSQPRNFLYWWKLNRG
ncbi:MAG: hypothetical protein HKN47_16295 [Pirellulaceae bacterium]|nr:hypothetical protein [Pirellulaceae bacterium]